jgi:hypothetical protein
MSGYIDTRTMITLLDKVIDDSFQHDPTRGLLEAVRKKMILLGAAQSAAKAGASRELLCQILDESN